MVPTRSVGDTVPVPARESRVPEHGNLRRCDKLSLHHRLQRLVRADPDVVHNTVRITVWGRWLLLSIVVLPTVYRPGHVLPEGLALPPPPLLTHVALHLLIILAPLVVNGYGPITGSSPKGR